MITKDLLFELPEPLSEPKIVNNFFTDEMFGRVKSVIDKTGLGTDSLKYHTMYARWEASSIVFDDDIEEYCLQKAKEIFNDNTLKKTYFFATRYQRRDCCVPHLWEHVDQNGTQTTIDITIENTAGWGISVEGLEFEQNPNDAVVFCGQQHTHSRPPYPTKDLDKYVTVLFLHFTQPNHWMQKEKGGIAKYGNDGNIRFFNRNRFLPLPDGPINQPMCECHNYWHMVDLYKTIVGDAVYSDPELVDTKIIDENEIAPGIVEYRISKESSRILKGLIQNSVYHQWKPAEVLYKNNGAKVDPDVRSCFVYYMNEKESSCHPQDPIRRAKESFQTIMSSAVEMYRKKYDIVNLKSTNTLLLRYEEGDGFINHIDDHPTMPRVVSVSMFLNDNFDGGELEFKEFGLKITPESGKIVIFCSAFPYSHKVNPVLKGIRYAAVKWYEFAKA